MKTGPCLSGTRKAQRPSDSLMMNPLVLLILVLLIIAALPAWPYSTGWGYYPSGSIGAVLLIVILLSTMRE